MKKKVQDLYKRGRIETVRLKKPIVFNNNIVIFAKIEIDHINYGLNKKTKTLNKNPRTYFKVSDIELFLELLDGEVITALRYYDHVAKFIHKIDCPIKGRFYNKEFFIIFCTDSYKPDEIHTITIYPKD